MSTTAPQPNRASLVVYLSSWLVLTAITAAVFASIGILDALVSGKPAWDDAARGAGTLGCIVGALTGFGLSMVFDANAKLWEVPAVGVGALLIAALFAALVYPIDGAKPGENLAPRFKETSDGVRELKLGKSIKSLPRGTLTVAVKDRQGNLSRIERAIAVGGPI
jgi:hypothetical protein